MIVVSASMKKAGSGWYFNMTNDLLVAAGRGDVRELRERYGLHDALRGGNCQVDRSRPTAVARVFVPYLRGETFVVKTHGRPWGGVRALMTAGVLRATYIYRDPRDVVLSILDHGRRLRAEGKHGNAASALETIEDAVHYVGSLLDIWEQWDRCPDVLTVRYEDLVDDPVHELRRLRSFLDLRVSSRTVSEIVERYGSRSRTAADRRNLHFNLGIVRRFEGALTRPNLDLCNDRFAPYLDRMGYAV